MASDDFYIRVAEPGDSSALEASFRFSLPRNRAVPEFLKLIEDSLYSFLALSSDDEVTAFAAFNDVPYIPTVEFGKRALEVRAWAMDMSSSHGFSIEKSLWVKLCCMSSLDTNTEEKYLKEFISLMFKLSPRTHAILSLSTFEHLNYEILKPLYSSEEMGFIVSICLQSMVLPSFNVKKAVVEYYDDLWPIVESAQKKGSVLSKIPDSAVPAYPYSLARLIAAQDAYNSVLVAEVDNNQVGLIAMTTSIDPQLGVNFQLDTYDGLISSEQGNGSYSYSQNKSEDQPNNEDQQSGDNVTEDSAGHDKAKNVQSAFQITMFCLEEEFQYKAIDILIAAFAYEGKDYCLVEVPYDKSLPEFFNYFTCVSKNEYVTAEDDLSSLYILHQHSLIQEFEVQLLKPQDSLSIKHLLVDVEDSNAIIDQLEHLRKKCCAFVATCQNDVVGFALVASECPIEALFSHFDLRSFVNINRQHEGMEAVMLYFVVGNLFANRRKYFLREIMRQMGKNVFCVPVFSSQYLSHVIKDMYFVPGRWHSSMSPPCIWWQPSSLSGQHSARLSQCMKPHHSITHSGALSKIGEYIGFDCALFTMTHQLIGRHRAIMNTRIVFVGASRTAASCLNSLISDANFKFSNLTLVSSLGLKSLSVNEKLFHDIEQGPSGSFRKSGVDYLVNVITDKVVSFDRKAKCVVLSNGNCIRYDYLILTTGLQDQTRYMLKIERNKGVFQIDELFVMIEESKICLNASEMKVPIIIYGLSLETFTAFQFLLSKGISGNLLVLVYPEFESLESFAEICFGDRDISLRVVTELRQSGITTRPGLRLLGVNSGPSNFLESVLLEDLCKKEGDTNSLDAGSVTCETGKINHIVQPCMLLVTCASKCVDQDIVQNIMKEGIVFNGRIVAEENFQTNDPFIFASGSCAKFSRKCGRQLNMEAYSSCELGRCLASAIISLFRKDVSDQHDDLRGSLSYALETTERFPRSLRLVQAKGVGTLLPGNAVYFHLNCPSERFSDIAVVKPFVMKKDGTVLRIELQSGEIRKIIYCGNDNLDAWKLIRIVGCYEPLINALVCSPNKGLFNLPDFFSQPWFRVVFHDKFYYIYSELCLESLEILKGSLPDEELVKNVISDGFIFFLDAYKADFPGLAIRNTSSNGMDHSEWKRKYNSNKVRKGKMMRNLPNPEQTLELVGQDTLTEGISSIVKSRGNQKDSGVSADADQSAERDIKLELEAVTQVFKNETGNLMGTSHVSLESDEENRRGKQDVGASVDVDQNAEKGKSFDFEAVTQVSKNEACDQKGISHVSLKGSGEKSRSKQDSGVSADTDEDAEKEVGLDVEAVVQELLDEICGKMGMLQQHVPVEGSGEKSRRGKQGSGALGDTDPNAATEIVEAVVQELCDETCGEMGMLQHSGEQGLPVKESSEPAAPQTKVLLTIKEDDCVSVTLSSAEGTMEEDPVKNETGLQYLQHDVSVKLLSKDDEDLVYVRFEIVDDKSSPVTHHIS